MVNGVDLLWTDLFGHVGALFDSEAVYARAVDWYALKSSVTLLVT